MTLKDGGPAFPGTQPMNWLDKHDPERHGVIAGPWSAGMSLRDYVAAQALPALLLHALSKDRPLSEAAFTAYDVADEVLKVRGEQS